MLLKFLVIISALVLVLEGLWVIIKPTRTKQITLQLLKHPATLRLLGLLELVAGLLIAAYAFKGP